MSLQEMRDLAALVARDASSRLLDRLVERIQEQRGDGTDAELTAAAIDVLGSLCDALAIPPSVSLLGALPLPALSGPESLLEGAIFSAPIGGALLAPALDAPLRRCVYASDAASAAAEGTDPPGPALEGKALTWTLVAADVLIALQAALGAFAVALGVALQAEQETRRQSPSPVLVSLARVVAAVAPFVSWAPWSTPHTQACAAAVLAAIAKCVPSAGIDSGITRSSPEHALRDCLAGRDALADALLSQCAADSAGPEWHAAPHLVYVRHAVAASVTALGSRALVDATRVSAVIPLAFRLCDDALSATSVWLGVSCISHILASAPQTVLRAAGHAQLITEVLRRAADCRHPTVVAAAGLTQAAARAVLYGPAPALPRPPPLHASSSGSSGKIAALPPPLILDGPYDDALSAALHALAVAAASPGRQYVVLAAMIIPLLGQLGTSSARHAAKVASALSTAVRDCGDARVVCAALAAMRALITASPLSFDVGDAQGEVDEGYFDDEERAAEVVLTTDAGEKGSDAAFRVDPRLAKRAARTLVDHAIAAAIVAVVQADAGLSVLPCSDWGVGGSVSAGAIVRAHAGGLVQALEGASASTGAYAARCAEAVADEVSREAHLPVSSD